MSDQTTLFEVSEVSETYRADEGNPEDDYSERLAEALEEGGIKDVEGFPEGSKEAILSLSEPPFYTACPNPFLEEWLEKHGSEYDPGEDSYQCPPFASDVSEGKKNNIYRAHSYHTKVPHRAVMRYILHYTSPGDVIYDGFAGTGMTGVAAQMCGSKEEVESLGYDVDSDGQIWESKSEEDAAEEDGKGSEDEPFSNLGRRKAILNELSPAATFIASGYNTPLHKERFYEAMKRFVEGGREQHGWMYTTLHQVEDGTPEDQASRLASARSAGEMQSVCESIPGNQKGEIQYIVWSDIFLCPECGQDVVFWDAAVDPDEANVEKSFSCPHCRSEMSKRSAERKMETIYDEALSETVEHQAQKPVLVYYKVGTSRYEKEPDVFDRKLIEKTNGLDVPHFFPTDPLPDGHNTAQPKRSHGYTHVHHFFTRRNLIALAALWEEAEDNALLQLPFSITTRAVNRMVAYNFKRGGNKPRAGTMYVSSIPVEANVFASARNKAPYLRHVAREFERTNLVTTGSATDTRLPENSIDYIFTDPPFGANIMYSEMNYLWEAWLGVKTNPEPEAIENDVQRKGLPEYQGLMAQCFEEYYRALKPGRWMTVEFHNSENAVWNAIQEAIERAGFVVADVRQIDKEHYSIQQYSRHGATKRDLVISCYKPHEHLQTQFEKSKGEADAVEAFIRQHLEMLPVAPRTDSGRLETLAERTLSILYNRMVTYHLVNGASIPLSVQEFENLLQEHFVAIEEHGQRFFFLPDQAAQYEALKARGVETEQLSIFLQDEETAVQWIRQELQGEPQTLGELTPKFMQELRDWPDHEPRPELEDLLREYFVQEGGKWKVPDPEDRKHLEQMRRNSLLRLFQEYVTSTGSLDTFRREAVLEGFRHCWSTDQYEVIVGVCDRIPEDILREDHDLTQMYDFAKDRVGELPEQLSFDWGS
jgi:DNA modification methylase/predicted RNA-binding Zn-ribbon protein involved in translation (DUF1610 family)